jgi:hypothetical protein
MDTIKLPVFLPLLPLNPMKGTGKFAGFIPTTFSVWKAMIFRLERSKVREILYNYFPENVCILSLCVTD